MRIAILTHGVSPFGHLYARSFVDLGHEAEVWSMTPYEGDEYGTTVRLLGPPGFKPWETPSRRQYLKTVWPVRRAVREWQPDVLLGMYVSSGGVLACVSGARHVVVSALGSDVFTRLHSRVWSRILRWESRRVRLVHAVSDALAKALTERLGLPPEKVVTAPIGVDTALLVPTPPEARPHTGHILCTRAHKPVYDQGTLVRAMRLLAGRGSRAHLTFTSTTEVESTRALVTEAGVADRVAFQPGFDYQELSGLLGSADVYVSASKSDGTSQSLLEALSTGTFPVVSDIPANRPWVTDGETGLLFPVGDAEALAACLDRAVTDDALRAAAAPKLRRLAEERGDLRRNAERLLERFGTFAGA